jgi:hypothetical protein
VERRASGGVSNLVETGTCQRSSVKLPKMRTQHTSAQSSAAEDENTAHRGAKLRHTQCRRAHGEKVEEDGEIE